MTSFDVSQIPFSRFGSYLTLSHPDHLSKAEPGLYLRIVNPYPHKRELFKIEAIDPQGTTIAHREIANPAALRLETDSGHAEFAFSDPNTIAFKTEGIGLRLTMPKPGSYNNALQIEDRLWEVNAAEQKTKLRLALAHGAAKASIAWEAMRCPKLAFTFLPDRNATAEGAIHEFIQEADDLSTVAYEKAKKNAKASFSQWLDTTLPTPEEFDATRTLASYVNWATVVAPRENVKRPAMYMSKNHMTNVWSWDHCFNAMALAKTNPDMAWDQFIFMFDYQNEHGALPDHVNHIDHTWSFSKPPVHGWIFAWMMARTNFSTERKRQAFHALSHWTDWWFARRDYNQNGIPQYNHGNDSGWDNCTIFHSGAPVESPDLSAFLVLQMDTLSELGSQLGQPDKAAHWKKRADALAEAFLSHFWTGESLQAKRNDGSTIPYSQTLFLYLPLILGDRLPRQIRETLVAQLSKPDFLITPHGPATESPASPYYVSDGYWRGPIWAPSTMIIVEGLQRCGEKELSRKIARSFCQMVKEHGMAENFDAQTGQGLRDLAYTWTSSVFLVLAHEYL